MTSKLQAGLSGIVSGISSFIAWLMTVPPEQQGALLGPLVELTPIAYRDSVGLAMRSLASLSTIYAVFQAARSGAPKPTTP